MMDPNPPDYSTYADWASVTYRPAGNSTGPNVSIDEQPRKPNGGSAVPSSSAHTVRVNGHPAVYVHGGYESSATSNPVWNPKADVEELSWQADGITYDMSASELHLSQRDLIRMADSVG
jgi:hypothetical protein